MSDFFTTPQSRERTDGTFGLRFVFALVIGCSVFFGLYLAWPPAAIMAAVLITPALIRVGNIERQFHLYRRSFGWSKRIRYFLDSLGLLFSSGILGAAAFLVTCLFCSLLGYGFGQVFNSEFVSPKEVAVIGATGGTVWGMTAAILTIGWYWTKKWLPDLRMEES